MTNTKKEPIEPHVVPLDSPDVPYSLVPVPSLGENKVSKFSDLSTKLSGALDTLKTSKDEVDKAQSTLNTAQVNYNNKLDEVNNLRNEIDKELNLVLGNNTQGRLRQAV